MTIIDKAAKIDEMCDYLNKAKELLDNVYYYGIDNDNKALSDEMSLADTCIIEAFKYINRMR